RARTSRRFPGCERRVLERPALARRDPAAVERRALRRALAVDRLPAARGTAVVAPPLPEDHARMGAALRGAVRLRRAWRQPAGHRPYLGSRLPPVRPASRD